MKKYLLIGLALTALLSTSCADDMPEDSIGTKTAPAVESVDTIRMYLRNLYEETWFSGCIEDAPYTYIEEPDVEDMIAFLTWAVDFYKVYKVKGIEYKKYPYYEFICESCWFTQVAELLGFTKVWHEEGYWEIYKD